jgi:hypothetical protein
MSVTRSVLRASALLITGTGILLGSVYATTADSYESVSLTSLKLNGPRLGMSYQLGRDIPEINGTKVGPLISQFGWHFEWLVKPEGGGPAFVTQLIPFLGGVEHSLLIPSMSLVLGIRMPVGFEFGMGPQVTTRFTKEEPVNPSLIIAVGQSINFSGVSIPLNLAVTTSKDGQALAFVFGYALPSRRA